MTETMIDFNATYKVAGYGGVAFYLKRFAQTPEETTYLDTDPETGEEVEVFGGYEMTDDTGFVIAVMVGDDTEHTIDVDDLTKIDEDDYCHECGQIGCTHDGRDRG